MPEKLYRIKPLVWVDATQWLFTTNGKYCIDVNGNITFGVHASDRTLAGLYLTADEAKAACESHYRSRLAEALEEVET